ncbi:MAG: hypothetical protein ACOY46_02890 [Bacillota bacterium]
MSNWFEMISQPSVRFFDSKNRVMTLQEVEEFFFNPAEIQFPSSHGMFVSHYFLSFWSVLLGDEVALFYLKLIDWYVYGEDKDFCFPSAGRIALDFDMSPNTVRARLKTLEKYGFVARFTVKDINTKQHFSSLIKIRKDIHLIPEDFLVDLPVHLQQAHKEYLQRIKKPANLVDQKTEKVYNAQETSQNHCYNKGVPQNLNKGGRSNSAHGGTSKIEQGGYSNSEQPPSISEQGGCLNSEVGVTQNLNPNLYPNNNCDLNINLSIYPDDDIEKLERDGLMDCTESEKAHCQKYVGKTPEEIIHDIKIRTGVSSEQMQRALKRANDLELQGKVKSSFIGLLESICKTIVDEDKTRELASRDDGELKRRRELFKKIYT